MYDYRKEMKKDLITFFQDNEINVYDLSKTDRDNLYDQLLIVDEVTGGGPCGHFVYTNDYKNAVFSNFDLLLEAAESFGFETLSFKTGPGVDFDDLITFDSIIRTYLLGEVLNEVLEELLTEGKNNEL